MSKSTKIWLIIGVVLTLIGGVIFTVALFNMNFNFSKLSEGKYQTKTYEATESFTGISIDDSTAKITFALSNDGVCKVVCHEEKKVPHSVNVENGVLVIKEQDNRKWYDYIGITFDTESVTVYLPASAYTSLLINTSTGDVTIPKDFIFERISISASTAYITCYASASDTVKIETDTGNITLSDVTVGKLDLEVSTGRVTLGGVVCEGDIRIGVSTGKCVLDDVSCASLISSGDTGDIHLTNVIASERFNIERSTGDVRFEGSDASEIYIETDTGDVTGTLLSEKIFFTDTSTGKVSVPKCMTGGKCEILTSTGDIKISITEK